jgi:hypothetical protein
VDWGNCLHHACSEVRAAALSGDCGWLREMSRGNLKFVKQLQVMIIMIFDIIDHYILIETSRLV